MQERERLALAVWGARQLGERAVSLLLSGLVSDACRAERSRAGAGPASGAWGGRHPANAPATVHTPFCPGGLSARTLTPASRNSDTPLELEARLGGLEAAHAWPPQGPPGLDVTPPAGVKPAESQAYPPERRAGRPQEAGESGVLGRLTGPAGAQLEQGEESVRGERPRLAQTLLPGRQHTVGAQETPRG